MSTHPFRRLWSAGLFCSCTVFCIHVQANELKKVDQVLATEATGKPINRREALADQSDDEMAQWQSGRILIDGKWIELEYITEHKLAPQLERYRKRRDSQELDTEGHRQVALWCQSHQLSEMAAIHWKAVTAVAVEDEQAHKALGHKNIDGKWFSREELDSAAEEKERLQTGLKKWLPQLLKIAKNLNSGDHNNKLGALRKLERINSADAVDALKVAALKVDSSVGVPLVSKIKAIRSKESCLALCEIALIDPNSDVGRLAVSGLLEYDQHFYVPELLQLLETPVSMSQELGYMPNGSLVVRYAYSKESMSEKRHAELYKIASNIDQNAYIGSLNEAEITEGELEGITNGEIHIVANSKQARSSIEQLSKINAKTEERNMEILNQFRQTLQVNAKTILSRVSGLKADASAQEFWSWWPAFNDQGTGAKRETRTYAIDDSDPIQLSTNATLFPCACLIAGTTIQSSSGLKPVEQFKVGDVVASLSIKTGEMSFRPVTHVSVRTAESTYQIHLNDGDIIRATGGHNWWVAGKGWCKSRELKAGQFMRTGDSSVEIAQVEKIEEPIKVYNLIVDENHTYFVGKDRLLSWDVTSLQPTLQTAPGLTKPVYATVK